MEYTITLSSDGREQEKETHAPAEGAQEDQLQPFVRRRAERGEHEDPDHDPDEKNHDAKADPPHRDVVRRH